MTDSTPTDSAPTEPTPTGPTLEAVPEDWDRALAVVAHPDDLEYGAASAIARWTAQGKTITYLLATSGEAGIDSMPPDECARLRQAEEIASAKVVGVDTVEFLAHPDGLVEASIELRRDLAAAIRRHRPEVLISLTHRETVAGGHNHSDHRAVGAALLDAVRDAANRWLFVGAGGDPWGGVRFVLFSNSPLAAHGVDVTDTVERGVESLAAHSGYLAALGDGTAGKDPAPFIRGMAATFGPMLGTEAATAFELIQM